MNKVQKPFYINPLIDTMMYVVHITCKYTKGLHNVFEGVTRGTGFIHGVDLVILGI